MGVEETEISHKAESTRAGALLIWLEVKDPLLQLATTTPMNDIYYIYNFSFFK